MTKIEKRKLITFQVTKLRQLSDIISAANELVYNNSVNIRSISDFDSRKFDITISNAALFEAVEEYKTLLTDFGELK